jgi:hypothetical protein
MVDLTVTISSEAERGALARCWKGTGPERDPDAGHLNVTYTRAALGQKSSLVRDSVGRQEGGDKDDADDGEIRRGRERASVVTMTNWARRAGCARYM